MQRPLILSTAALAALVLIDQFPSALLEASGMQMFEGFQRTLNRLELNEEDSADQTAGYYEGLLNESSRRSSMGAFTSGRFGFGSRRVSKHPTIRALRLEDRYVKRGDFLTYEARSNLDVADYDDETLRLVTNSRGLSDREYSPVKPPGTRRIAVLGDSVARGQGAPFGSSFEALLETALNGNGRDTQRFELINFAVSGYRVTQLLETAVERAPEFAPDAYALTISELTVFSRWGDHLKELVDQKVDLKYDFLREVVRQSGLVPGDPIATAEAKLAPYRIPTVRWVVETIRERATSNGATMAVILVPVVKERAVLDSSFEGIPEMLDELGVPVINLLGTFAGVKDLNTARVSSDNYHPNARGHRLLFEQILGTIGSQPPIRAALLGSGDVPANR